MKGFRMFLLTGLALLLLLGCRSRESQLAGRWNGNRSVLTLTDDHRWSFPIFNMNFEGKWDFEGNDVILTPITVSGMPVATAKEKLEDYAEKATGNNQKLIEAFANDIDKKNYFVLSDDGKSMSTDTKRDKNGGGVQHYDKITP